MRLTFQGPEDAVFVPGVGEVKLGESVTVGPVLAGKATVEHADAEHEIGWGLLAQTYTDPGSGGRVPSWVEHAPAAKAAVTGSIVKEA